MVEGSFSNVDGSGYPGVGLDNSNLTLDEFETLNSTGDLDDLDVGVDVPELDDDNFCSTDLMMSASEIRLAALVELPKVKELFPNFFKLFEMMTAMNCSFDDVQGLFEKDEDDNVSNVVGPVPGGEYNE